MIFIESLIITGKKLLVVINKYLLFSIIILLSCNKTEIDEKVIFTVPVKIKNTSARFLPKRYETTLEFCGLDTRKIMYFRVDIEAMTLYRHYQFYNHFNDSNYVIKAQFRNDSLSLGYLIRWKHCNEDYKDFINADTITSNLNSKIIKSLYPAYKGFVETKAIREIQINNLSDYVPNYYNFGLVIK